MRNQNGVSLITLVITIIVVIILAAIALGNGVLDLGGRAQFTGFTEKMGQIQADVATAVEDASGAVAQAGVSVKSIEQRRNYVARGGNINEFDTAHETNWLTVADAKAVVTMLDPNGKTSGKIIGGDRQIKVDTVNQRGQVVSIFLTPKGNVFCWPPYVSEERAYVNSSVVAKIASGDVGDIEAALGEDATITFPNGEVVTVKNDDSADKGEQAVSSTANTYTIYYNDTNGTAYGYDMDAIIAGY